MMRPPSSSSDASPRYPVNKKATDQHQSTEAQSTGSTSLIVLDSTSNIVQQYSLTLELTCARTNSSKSKENTDTDQIRKVEAIDGSIRLIATMPYSFVDGEQANLTAALLFEQIDQLAVTSNTYRVERVKINSLQFTNEAIVAIQGFLSVYTDTIKHVSMKDILTEKYTPAEEQSFVELCHVFDLCQLETLNLSDNTITAPIWKCWLKQTQIRQLILDFVDIPDDSLCEMSQHFTYGDSLEELYVVLTNHIGPTGVIAANNVLKQCRCVGSLRWAVKDAPPDALMPWRGLADLAQEMSDTGKVPTLLHLVMDGGTITEEDCGVMGIGGALEYFTQIKSIKLRSIGLKDIGALHIANALRIAQPPLEVLDLSRNYIQSTSILSIAGLSEVDNIATNLKCLSMERNSIDSDGAINLFTAFGTKGRQKLDIKLDGNPFSFSKVACALARRTDRDDLFNDAQNSNHTNQVSNDVKGLQRQVQILKDEKAILMQAFSVMGSANCVVEYTRMLQRISSLEKIAFGQPQDETQIGNHMMLDIDASIQRTTISEHSSRIQEAPMTPNGSNHRATVYTNQSQIMNHALNPLRSPMSIQANTKNKSSNTINGSSGNEYWAASPASSYCSNSNQKKKVGGITGSISETPNMHQSSPGLGGFMAKRSVSNSRSANQEYDDATKSGRSIASSASNTRYPSPYLKR